MAAKNHEKTDQWCLPDLTRCKSYEVPLLEDAQAFVVWPKVVTPLADAVSLIHCNPVLQTGSEQFTSACQPTVVLRSFGGFQSAMKSKGVTPLTVV